MRLIDADALLEAYDREHVGPPGRARTLIEEAQTVAEHETTTFKPHYIDKYGKHFICGVECGACHKEISSTYHYCPYCGRFVKWE